MGFFSVFMFYIFYKEMIELNTQFMYYTIG